MRLLTLPEVARIYAMHPKTLHKQVRTGTARVMPCMGGGRGVRYKWRAEDVERDVRTATLSDRLLQELRAS